MIRPIAFLSLLGLGGVGVGMSANACRCFDPPPPTEEYKSSTAVFVGTVVSGSLDGDYGRRYEFKVEESLKGKLKDKVEVFTGSDSGICGRSFQIGEKYLVYAGGSQEKLSTTICDRTKPCNFAGYGGGEEETGKAEAEELKAKLHSDLYGDDQKTNAVVDLSGEWTFSTGYVFGQMSLVQSNSHVSGTYNYTTDAMTHGKCKIGGEIRYPKVILFFDCGSKFDSTNVFSVVLWKDGKRFYLKSENRAYSPDFLRPGMK